MTRINCKKLICLLLAVIITASFIPPISVVAEEREKTHSELLKDVVAGVLTVEEAFGTLDADTVPEIVGYESAVAKTHIQRLYEEEGDNLNKVIFLNADGSRTAYYYDHPVKYIDEKGKIKDITLNITEADATGQFETAANSSVTTFSKNVSDGIGLRGNGTSVSLVPHLPTFATKSATAAKAVANATARKIDDKTVAYTYDDKTTLEYSLTYTGFKEDIVVSEYTGQTRYDFTLYTNGSKLMEKEGSFYLVDTTGSVKAQLGDIIIFTADDKNNTMGDMVAKTVVENQEYLLTILIDPEFLSDEKTAYPIRIDPTVEITYEDNGNGAIDDVTINSNGGSDGTAYSLSVGLRSNYGIARTLMNFPILERDTWGLEAVIQNAQVKIRDLMCEEEALQVDCYIFTGNEWTESSANWSNVQPNSISTLLSSHTISYAHGAQQPEWQTYAFDITAAVEGWWTGNCNPGKGIIFKSPDTIENGTQYIHKTLGSFNRASYKPTVSVTYTYVTNQFLEPTYYLNNKQWGTYLRKELSALRPVRGTTSGLGPTIEWEIVPVDGGFVFKHKQDTSLYLAVPTDRNSNAVIFKDVNESVLPEECIWTVSAVGGCLLRNKYNSRYLYTDGTSVTTVSSTGTAGTDTYDACVWRIISNVDIEGKELAYNYTTFHRGYLLVGYPDTIKYRTNPSNAIWASREEFLYSGYNTSVISVSTDGVVTPIAQGTTTITCTHKVTNLSFNVLVEVFDHLPNLNKNLSYWANVESSIIGHWPTPPTIYKEKLDPSPSFTFYEGYTTARNLWSNTLELSMTETSDESSANIKVYGGTGDQLRARNFNVTNGQAGLTVYTDTDLTGYYLYNGSARIHYNMVKADICIVSDYMQDGSTPTASQYANTCIHEFGHAMGFFGHASSESAVMYYATNGATQLESLEKNHLLQIYGNPN